jgi:hypothetical protein
MPNNEVKTKKLPPIMYLVKLYIKTNSFRVLKLIEKNPWNFFGTLIQIWIKKIQKIKIKPRNLKEHTK